VNASERHAGCRIQDGVDDEERQALRDEGLDPDDPAVIAAIDIVRWELSLGVNAWFLAETRVKAEGLS
jgi:hypothetical protein